MSSISKHYRKLHIVRWIARVISSLSIAFFLFIFIGECISNFGPLTLEGVMIAGFAVVLMVGVLISWWKEGIGGIILIISGVIFAIFIYLTAGTNRILASTLISSPFWTSGVLFLIIRYKIGDNKKM
ncbi:DUF7670 domain-containing protein [Vallitalea maricola]|uniref:Uncharacterized protein n=1 Tax=Vallitalea maricola TaxID=3074433 RepID=A0ACB5UIC4_9FIRM|nr:hypothetical protein AN2V17_19360 [Vallitalea sp. AN17-2]